MSDFKMKTKASGFVILVKTLYFKKVILYVMKGGHGESGQDCGTF